MLNKDGGIETDLTVVCIDKNHFRIVSSAATRERDKFHILKNIYLKMLNLKMLQMICVSWFIWS